MDDEVLQVDLNKLPLPWEDNSVDEIVLFAVVVLIQYEIYITDEQESFVSI